jgi:hypothetical protein
MPHNHNNASCRVVGTNYVNIFVMWRDCGHFSLRDKQQSYRADLLNQVRNLINKKHS